MHKARLEAMLEAISAHELGRDDDAVLLARGATRPADSTNTRSAVRAGVLREPLRACRVRIASNAASDRTLRLLGWPAPRESSMGRAMGGC